MNEDERKALREKVLGGDNLLPFQIEWCRKSLEEHIKTEQQLKAKFRLADYLGDTDMLTNVEKHIKAVRSSIVWLVREIQTLEAECPPQS